MTLERGSLLNKRFRIVEILGQGGMAAVYRALDENLGVEVAVKENLFTTEEYARQFRLEATILANLRHPNLPRVTDHFVIEQQGQYLVMDYIEGEDLRQRMDRIGPLPEQEVIVLGVALTDALAYLHSRKPMVVHRDIKPGNVRITPQGNIYLVDFGLAKVVQGREVTSTGARAMTPGYSPPEQYGTARTDHRSDIYALGATLYSALTDQMPEDALARAMDQAELTPLATHNPQISRRLAMAIEKSLEVRPDDRYQSADEFKEALLEARSTSRRRDPLELILPPPPILLHDSLPDHYVDGSDDYPAPADKPSKDAEPEKPALVASRVKLITHGSDSQPRRRTGMWLFFALIILLLAGSAAVYVINPDLPNIALARLFVPPSPTITQSLPTSTLVSASLLTETPPSQLNGIFTPTVKASPSQIPTQTPQPSATPTLPPSPTPMGGGSGQIAFASDRTGSPEVWVINVDGTGLTQLTFIEEGACQPKWSPNGLRLVFISPCPKNQMIYAGASLFLMNADGSDLIPLPSVPGGDYDPTWSPNGERIAFTSLRGGGIPQIHIINLLDFSVSSLPEGDQKSNSQPAWAPGGGIIAFIASDNRIWAMRPDGSNRSRLSIGAGEFINGEPSWSPDGSVVVFTRRKVNDTSSYTWLMALPYSKEGALPAEVPNSELITEASYSPDGFWLVFKSWHEGSHDIYVMRSNGVDKRVLVSAEGYDFDPSWRPVVIQP